MATDRRSASEAREAGRKPEVDLREVLNAIRYMTRAGGCPYRKLDPDVVMVQSSDHRNGFDPTGALNRPMVWRVFAQREVCAGLVIVRPVRSKNLA
jgi:hypothetical protein